MRSYNFSSGPAVLPFTVLEQSAQAITDLQYQGVSIAEISHRNKLFTDILEEFISLLYELLNLSARHEVIILQGGARLQFAQIPMNFLAENLTAGFIDTGYWAHKAMEYASFYGKAISIASGAENGYTRIPEVPVFGDNLAYVHITSNNTIYGTQYQQLPAIDRPLIVDMSSDILSIERDFEQIDFAFACAQKNIGPAGVSVGIIKKSFLEKASSNLPPVFSYKNLAAKKSNYATPPVVNIYMSLLNLRWLKAQGGVTGIQTINEEKARLLYEEIERNPLFDCKVNNLDRSRMNVCFFAKDENTEAAFLNLCKEKKIIGIKGHKVAGGLRASVYNAQPPENVLYLIDVMKEFEKNFSL